MTLPYDCCGGSEYTACTEADSLLLLSCIGCKRCCAKQQQLALLPADVNRCCTVAADLLASLCTFLQLALVLLNLGLLSATRTELQVIKAPSSVSHG